MKLLDNVSVAIEQYQVSVIGFLVTYEFLQLCFRLNHDYEMVPLIFRYALLNS